MQCAWGFKEGWEHLQSSVVVVDEVVDSVVLLEVLLSDNVLDSVVDVVDVGSEVVSVDIEVVDSSVVVVVLLEVLVDDSSAVDVSVSEVVVDTVVVADVGSSAASADIEVVDSSTAAVLLEEALVGDIAVVDASVTDVVVDAAVVADVGSSVVSVDIEVVDFPMATVLLEEALVGSVAEGLPELLFVDDLKVVSVLATGVDDVLGTCDPAATSAEVAGVGVDDTVVAGSRPRAKTERWVVRQSTVSGDVPPMTVSSADHSSAASSHVKHVGDFMDPSGNVNWMGFTSPLTGVGLPLSSRKVKVTTEPSSISVLRAPSASDEGEPDVKIKSSVPAKFRMSCRLLAGTEMLRPLASISRDSSTPTFPGSTRATSISSPVAIFCSGMVGWFWGFTHHSRLLFCLRFAVEGLLPSASALLWMSGWFSKTPRQRQRREDWTGRSHRPAAAATALPESNPHPTPPATTQKPLPRPPSRTSRLCPRNASSPSAIHAPSNALPRSRHAQCRRQTKQGPLWWWKSPPTKTHAQERASRWPGHERVKLPVSGAWATGQRCTSPPTKLGF